jgi:hypothetical protein
MVRNKKYLIWSLLICFSPTILFHLFLFPMWEGGVSESTKASMYSLTFTSFIVPVYTLVVNYFLSKKYKFYNILVIASIVLINIFLSTYMEIYNWERITTGSFETGNESEGVITLERIIAISISAIGLIIWYFNRNQSLDNEDTKEH